jgi:hypothetical protein
MSQDLARQNSEHAPAAAVSIAIASGALYGAALNGIANHRYRRWLSRRVGPHCTQALELIRRLEARVTELAAPLPAEDIRLINEAREFASWAIGVRYTEQGFREWVVAWNLENPKDGPLGASERFLRAAFQKLFDAAVTLEQSGDPRCRKVGRELRATIIREGRETVGLDLTPRAGINIHREDRRRLLFVMSIPLIVTILAGTFAYIDSKIGEWQRHRHHPIESIRRQPAPTAIRPGSHRTAHTSSRINDGRQSPALAIGARE